MVKGLGIDAVELDRFRSVLTRRPQLVERMFSEEERSYSAQFADPIPRLAARFAVKEAVMKAMGVGLGAFPLRDVEVTRELDGKPHLKVKGKANKLAEDKEIKNWLVSLTHTDRIAEAVVVAQ